MTCRFIIPSELVISLNELEYFLISLDRLLISEIELDIISNRPANITK